MGAYWREQNMILMLVPTRETAHDSYGDADLGSDSGKATGCGFAEAGYVSYHVSDVYGNKRYHVSKEFENFDLEKMNNRCKQLGGYLLQPDDTQEGYFAVKYARRTGWGPFFTGITDKDSEGKFYYYNDNKPAKSITWKWFQPDNWYNEDCVEVWIDGYNDRHCGIRGRYICEVPA
ncbi:collectin-11 [Plakobranchus ocellatus]|uniref:Collectin-11 n=1 Tax=Plakobranchus ocellatus TaxID=259542 RepID=A0AAV4BQC2_9GAST|nr:collectin-11 [Plakobranchus ocellatus]